MDIKTISVTYTTTGGSQTETHILTFSADPAAGGSVTVGTSTSGSIELEEDDEVSIFATPAEVGYAFSNWTLNPTTTGAALGSATNASTTFTMGEDDVELIAHFSTVTTYTVTYHANVTGIADIEEEYNVGTDVTVAANTFSNPGYAFTKWTTNENGTGDEYQPGATIENISSDIDLYAQWEVSTQATATLNIQAYAEANDWVNGTKYATATVSPVTFTANGGDNTGKYYDSGHDWRFYQNESASITISVAEGYTLVSVTPTYSGSNYGVLKNGNTTVASGTTVNVSGTSATFTVDNSGSATNGQVRFTNIVVIYESEGSTPAPSFEISNNEELAYNATSGSFNFTVNNPVEGGNTTVDENVDWISEATVVNGSTVTFTTSANPAAVQREGVVTLTYHYGEETKTHDVTVTQAGNPNVFDNISSITEVGTTYSVKGTVVATNARGFIIGDGTGYVYTYLADTPTQQIGDKLSISGTTGQYGHIIQFTSSATIGTVEETNYDGTPEVQVITEVPDYSEGYHISDFFQFEGNLTKETSGNYINYNIAVGESRIRISYPTDAQVTELEALLNKTVRVQGYFAGISGTGNNATFTAMMKSIEEVVVPYINLDQYTFNYDYVAQGGYHTITYGNLDNPSFGVVYCDAQGNVLQDQTKPAMIAAAQVENNELYLTVSLNEGSASRTTYLKVRTTNTTTTYYSDLITVTQTGYAPSITVTPTTVEATAAATSGTISAISDIIYSAPYSPVIKYYYYEGETLTETTAAYYSWLTATITNGSPLVTNGTINYTISANDGAARTAYMKVYAKDYYNTDVYSELITISQDEFVVDYATLPFSWAGGTSSELTALTGVTGNSLGDYAATNAPYRVQFDKTGDYIQVKTDSQPGIVTIGVKMIGGGNTSYITVQGSADGETFDDGEALEISGSQNDILTLTSSRSFGENVRYVRLYFTKGSNVGVGPISITKYVAPTNHDLTVTLSENVEAIFVFNATNLDDALIEDGTAGTVQVLSGTSIVVSPVAASGYVISSLSVNNQDVTSQMDETGAYTFSMPANDVTITATAALEPHIIMFSVNGYEFEEGEMAITPGQPLGELPVPSENIPEGFTFVGWMESPTDAYYNATSAPTMVNSTTVPEDDMILDAVFCISETEQGTYVLNNAAPTDGDWVVLAVNVDGTYYAMNGPVVEQLEVANNTIVGTPDAVFEAKKLTQNDIDYIGLTQDGGIQYVHLNSNAIKIANGETNGYLEFTQSGTGYLVSTEATTNNGVVTRYIKYNTSNFTVTTDETEASTLYVFTYVPGATTNMDYTTSVTVHESGYIANDQEETLYGIHYIDGYVFAGNELTNSGKLVVNNEGILDMYGSELVNTEVANFVIKDGGQYKGDEVLASVEKVILPYTPGVKNNWYAISMPFNYGINPGIDGYMTEMVTDNDNELTYDFYRFDNLYLKAEWRNYRLNEGFGMTVGQGYLYAHKNGITLNFTGTLNATSANITSTVFNNGSSNYPDTYPFADWFFAGNPFPCSATIVGFEDFYVMNESGSNFVISYGGVLNPLQGAMIYDAEAPTGNGYTITYQVQGMSKSNNGNETDKGMINLSISQDNELVDMARVRFGEGSMLGKFNFNENATKLYIPQGKKDYAVVRAQSEGEMPVSFKATKSGIYTFSVEPKNVEMTYLHLIDNKTGEDVDLLANPSYTFEARITDYASRFRLVFSANDGSNEEGNETFAFFNGSEWVISNMGEATLQVVDVMGRVLSTETVSGNATINLNQMPGVYMLRLVNGDSVKVQKVVVR